MAHITDVLQQLKPAWRKGQATINAFKHDDAQFSFQHVNQLDPCGFEWT